MTMTSTTTGNDDPHQRRRRLPVSTSTPERSPHLRNDVRVAPCRTVVEEEDESGEDR